MTTETQLVLERLLVLLNAQPPHLATALQQIDDLLKKKPCAAETEAIKKTTVRLLDHLATPILEGNPEMRAIAAGLRERIVQSGSLSGFRAPLEKASAWIVSPPVINDAKETIPQHLSNRLLTVLKLFGESSVQISTEIIRLLDAQPTSNPWTEIQYLLNYISTLEPHSVSTPWMLEQQTIRHALLTGLEAWFANQQTTTKKNPSHPTTLPDDTPNTINEWTLLLRQTGKELRQRARSLAGRIADNKEMAERLSKRLRQLEEALSQARIEGFMDPVTGLPDRFAFTAQLKRHLERAVHLNESFSLALLHVYDFASLVQPLGRQGEVRLVDGMIREIRRHLREEEYLARLSVERFVILFPKSDQNRAEIAMRAIETMLHQTQFILDDQTIQLEIYGGCVALGPEMTGQEMLEMTDRVAAASREETRERIPLLVPTRICSC